MKTLFYRKIFAFFLFSILFLDARASVMQENSEPRRGILYRIKLEGVHRGYLLGVAHVSNTTLDRLPKYIDDAAYRSDRIFFESDVRDVISKSNEYLKAITKPDSIILKESVSEATLHKLDSFFSKLGYSSKRKAFLLNLPLFKFTALFSPELTWEQINAGSLERLLFIKYGATKFAGGLETWDQSSEFLEGFTKEEWSAFVLETVDCFEREKCQTDKVLIQRKVWELAQSGALKELEELVNKYNELYPVQKAFEKKMIFDRNGRLAKRIQVELEAGKTSMVVVGALHLIGTDGIVQYLRDQDYVVEEITN